MNSKKAFFNHKVYFVLKNHENMPWVFACLGVTLTTLTFLMGDRLNVGQGFGWDGVLFGELAMDFYSRIEQGVNQFWMCRVFPSWIIFHAVNLLPIQSNPEIIVRAFGLLNIFSMGLVGYFWGLIAQELKISIRGQWLGFVGLFFNFAVLKAMSYLTVKTDIVAYAIAMGMLYVYLTNKKNWLYFLIIIGSFTWPALLPMGALLLLFPRNNRELPKENKSQFWSYRYKLHLWGAFIIALAGGIYMNELLPGDLDYLNLGKPLESVGYLSLALATIYVFLGVSKILNNPVYFSWETWKKYCYKPSFFISLVYLSIVAVLPSLLATELGNTMTLGHTLYLVTLTSILQPGVFFIAHVVYWGPCIILIAFLWGKICRTIHQYGLGLTLWITISVIHSLDSESRHFVTFYPLLIPFLVKVIEDFNWKNWQYWGLAISSLLVSKVWLKIGAIEGEFREFPSQLWFMNQGPWMSNFMYVVQGVVVLALTYWLYDFYLRDTRKM